MKDVVYECLDLRREVKNPLSGLVLVISIPGGFEVLQHEGHVEQFRFEDDDQFEESGGTTIFAMPNGNVTFVPLTLEDFERLEGSEYFDTPKFSSTEDLQDFFRYRIENI